MIRSLYSGISGLQAHQTKLNVIGNNIANVNTYGFKSSRIVFSDVLYQNLKSAAAPTDSVGGTDASQLGYGTQVASIDTINTPASGADTGRAMDVFINGEGYLAVQTGVDGADAATNYTRVGDLTFDVNGNLTDRNGSFIMGNNEADTPITAGTAVTDLARIHVDPATLDTYSGISIGSTGEITAIDSTDTPVTIGHIAVVKFRNPDGLTKTGDGYLKASKNSGDPLASAAGEGGTGALKSSALEMSNVDLSKEFTEMITAQRGFQACSRVITVSDTILEELVNLKR